MRGDRGAKAPIICKVGGEGGGQSFQYHMRLQVMDTVPVGA